MCLLYTVEQRGRVIAHSSTRRQSYIQINKEIGFMVCSWIKGKGSANLNRSSLCGGMVFRQNYLGRERDGGYFLHTLPIATHGPKGRLCHFSLSLTSGRRLCHFFYGCEAIASLTVHVNISNPPRTSFTQGFLCSLPRELSLAARI